MIRMTMYIMSKTNVTEYMLTKSLVTERIGKWTLALAKFSLIYSP